MLETNNLILKEYDEKYIEQAHNNFFSSHITAKYVLWRPTNSPIEVKEKIEYWLYDVKFSIFFLIHRKDGDEPIGFIAVNETAPGVYGDLGIVIGEKYVSRGYGSEVLNEIITYIKSLGGKELHYSHFRENDASKYLALKFGFEFYKEEKRIRRYDNKEFDELFYVLKF